MMRVLGQVCARGTMLLAVALPSYVAAQGAATHSSNIWDVTFARDEASVATVARGEVRVWVLPSGKLACRLDGDYYGAQITTDGASGYHITLVETNRNVHRPKRAFRVEPATCAQVAVPVVEGTTGSYVAAQRYVVRAPDGRILPNGFATAPDSRLMIRSAATGFTIETPGGARLESSAMPTALEAGATTYVCTSTPKKITYHRITGERRVEKVGESDADRYGMSGCSTLSLSADSSILLNVGDGAAIDLDRKRVLVTYPVSAPTSIGLDAARQRLTIGSSSGTTVVDVRSGKQVGGSGRGSQHGYVSHTGEWMAIASDLISRPLVSITGRSQPNVVLDDAQSRPAADILGARREEEIRVREAAEKAEAARAAAARAEARAYAVARQQRLREIVERMIGPAELAVTLRQIQYQGAYDFIPVTVRVGDVLVLVSERDGVVGYSISDGAQILRGERTTDQSTEGFTIARSTMTGNVSGNLLVQGRGAPVYVFLVRQANVR